MSRTWLRLDCFLCEQPTRHSFVWRTERLRRRFGKEIVSCTGASHVRSGGLPESRFCFLKLQKPDEERSVPFSLISVTVAWRYHQLFWLRRNMQNHARSKFSWQSFASFFFALQRPHWLLSAMLAWDCSCFGFSSSPSPSEAPSSGSASGFGAPCAPLSLFPLVLENPTVVARMLVLCRAYYESKEPQKIRNLTLRFSKLFYQLLVPSAESRNHWVALHAASIHQGFPQNKAVLQTFCASHTFAMHAVHTVHAVPHFLASRFSVRTFKSVDHRRTGKRKPIHLISTSG